MRRMTALLGATAIVLATTSALAQKTSFAGTWVREAPAAGAAEAGCGGGRGGGGGGGGWGMEPTITQDATTLTVKWVNPGREGGEPTPQTRTYKLDGTESKNSIMRGGQATEVVSKASWDGAKLVIKTTTPAGETTTVVSIEAGKLTIAVTNPGREGGAPTTNTITYTKKA